MELNNLGIKGKILCEYKAHKNKSRSERLQTSEDLDEGSGLSNCENVT